MSEEVINRMEELIKSLKLFPHPSMGGQVRECFRSKSTYQLDRGTRNCSGVIYYLLRGNDYSQWHKLKVDEYYCFYEGSSLSVNLIYPDSDQIQVVTLGRDVSNGEVFHVEIPADTWVGAFPVDKCSYSLIGCVTAPAFDIADFTLATPQDMEHVKDEKKEKFFSKH